MEYLTIIALILILSTGYIQSIKTKNNRPNDQIVAIIFQLYFG